MRRPAGALHVVVDEAASTNIDAKSTTSVVPKPSQPPPPPPSLKLLFSLLTRRDVATLLLPAIFVSLVNSAVPPAMTQVIGIAFNAYSAYPGSAKATQQDRDNLLHDVGFAALLLIALAGGALLLSSLSSFFWIWVGEKNVRRLRMLVYEAVTSREMEWFDLRLGAEDTDAVAEGTDEEKVGAGGLMAKFSKDTEDVRMATSLNMGQLIQFAFTLIACLVLALRRSWSLTLVILSSVPILIIVSGFIQAFARAFNDGQRAKMSQAGTIIDRAVASIATVKAFNAASHEQASVNNVFEQTRQLSNKLGALWGLSVGVGGFIAMSMFVQGFWFGSKLVREGSATPGDVVAVFWACLIAASTLQLMVPLLMVLSKGKMAMSALVALIGPITPPTPGTPVTPSFQPALPLARRSAYGFFESTSNPPIRLANNAQFRPRKCEGEFELHNIDFAYPSRPSVPVLQDLSIYLPAGEMTFIVGGSGSGKSTIAQLLLRLYEPQAGSIDLDDQALQTIARDWCKTHIASVSQSCILFDMSVHDNVAMGFAGSGRTPESATREEVINACRMSLMHEFVRDLPDGYDTMLGTGGANLSGGQKQRLAIARAIMRNPTVLILDEATSALDATSRLLVFEAIRSWRHNRTTFVITHDLSQIAPTDFLYMLQDGAVIEQGYRSDLESYSAGVFRALMDRQARDGGFEVKAEPEIYPTSDQVTNEIDAILEEVNGHGQALRRTLRHQSTLGVAGGHSSGVWMLDAVTDLTTKGRKSRQSILPPRRTSAFPPAMSDIKINPRHLSSQFPSPPTSATKQYFHGRQSLQFEPKSPLYPPNKGFGSPESSTESFEHVQIADYDEAFELEKTAINISGAGAQAGRRNQGVNRKRWTRPQSISPKSKRDRKAAKAKKQASTQTGHSDSPQPSLFATLRKIFPTVPNKLTVVLGLFFALLSGASTPVFAYLLSLLLVEVMTGAQRVDIITFYACLVLVIAAGSGMADGLKYFFLDISANGWIASLRSKSFAKILRQDKSFFDQSSNSSDRIVQLLIQDGDDARALIGTIIGQFIVVIAMLGTGLVWALVTGWQLTLVGIAMVPVFATAMAVQSGLVAKFESRNKIAREDVAKKYYDSVANIRAIRSMGLEGVFRSHFDKSLDVALKAGVRGAFVDGCTFGVANALIYLSEALLFFVSAVFMANGIYTYSQMLQVLNLVVFTVTIGSQMMAFVQRIGKAVQAAHALGKVLDLTDDPIESQGKLRYPIKGAIEFQNVSFAYPQRPEAQILKDMSFRVVPGECVAIVGSSGSGKSTIASLLQRLYEPTGGAINLDRNRLSTAEVVWLRDHVAIVSQHAQLFDASITDNISYGSSVVSIGEVERAAKEANVHDFIMSLSKGYDTLVGENASLISGGQAQRIQIARALVRTASILILDECTSALDSTNQDIVMKTIMAVKRGRTTIIITHSLPVMKQCERIIVLDQGVLKEEGSFESLMDRRGHFFQLTKAGEWVSE